MIVLAAISLTFWPGWSAGGASRAPESSSAPDRSDAPPEYRMSQYRYDLEPNRIGVSTTIDRVLEQAADDFSRMSLNPSDVDQLRQRLRERLGLLLDPRFEQWQEIAKQAYKQDGVEVPSGYQAEIESESHKELVRAWKNSAELLEMSPIASEGILVRKISPSAGPTMGEPRTIFMRSGGFDTPALDYPDAPSGDPSTKLVEILVPMIYRQSENIDLPVTCVFRFYRTAGQPTWRPTDLFMYFGHQAMGKDLHFPIY